MRPTDEKGANSALSRDPKILWHLHEGDGPTIGLAVHAGHEIRADLLPYLAIDEATRIREEDPYTDFWTLACDSQIITRRSRFEVDLNRPSDHAICVQPADCWNLEVWSEELPQSLTERSLAEHAAFYQMLGRVLTGLEQRHGRFVVYDIHSYNHRRHGPREEAADPAANPEINIGTGTMNRELWAPVVDRFIAELRGFDFLGRHLDVRENVKFKGGYLAQFVHENFPASGCALAIEVKKSFMDEWTGVGFPEQINAVRDAFEATVPYVAKELACL
jgi:N-formylglutamate amidohydrolase